MKIWENSFSFYENLPFWALGELKNRPTGTPED